LTAVSSTAPRLDGDGGIVPQANKIIRLGETLAFLKYGTSPALLHMAPAKHRTSAAKRVIYKMQVAAAAAAAAAACSSSKTMRSSLCPASYATQPIGIVSQNRALAALCSKQVISSIYAIFIKP
jgi:hypothetical protein